MWRTLYRMYEWRIYSHQLRLYKPNGKGCLGMCIRDGRRDGGRLNPLETEQQVLPKLC